MNGRHIHVIYGEDIRTMTRSLLESADASADIPKNGHVVLKPNLVVARPAHEGATTHTEIVEGLLLYLKDLGVSRITIAEGSWVGDSTERAFRVTGLDRLAKRYGADLLDLKRDSTVSKDTPIGPISLCRTPLEADCLINLPVLKGHCQTVMTCSLKNLKGCIPDSEKRRFHSLGLTKPIAALAGALHPHLTLVDNICGDLNFEEGGNPVKTDRLLLGRDPVQLDAYCCNLMGLDISEVPYLPLAERYGAGRMARSEKDMVYLNAPTVSASVGTDSRLVRSLTKSVDQRSACSACFANLTRALYQYRERTGRNYSGKICIGQDFQGKVPEGLGIGRCCRCAEECVPGCPPTSAEILQKLL